jgi:alkylation response protein AidB-like acyl-CoA dehydrogenase
VNSRSHDEIVGRARDLVPTIAARAEETERLRAPHDDTIRELIDAELFSILVPKRWGGLGLDEQQRTILRITPEKVFFQE